MVCYVFKGKSGCNLIHLPVHKPVGEGLIPKELSLKTEESATTLGSFVFSYWCAWSHSRSYTVNSGSELFKELQKPVVFGTLCHFFFHQVYLHNSHKAAEIAYNKDLKYP